jgi:hypothetical protein
VLKLSLGGINKKSVQDLVQYSLNNWLLSNNIITALFVCYHYWFWTGWGVQVMPYSKIVFVFHVLLFNPYTVKPRQFEVLGPKNQALFVCVCVCVCVACVRVCARVCVRVRACVHTPIMWCTTVNRKSLHSCHICQTSADGIFIVSYDRSQLCFVSNHLFTLLPQNFAVYP